MPRVIGRKCLCPPRDFVGIILVSSDRPTLIKNVDTRFMFASFANMFLSFRQCHTILPRLA